MSNRGYSLAMVPQWEGSGSLKNIYVIERYSPPTVGGYGPLYYYPGMTSRGMVMGILKLIALRGSWSMTD